MNEIKARLIEFMNDYNKNNIEDLNEFIDEFFIKEEDASLVGPGLDEWYFGVEEIKESIKDYWIREDKYLKNINLDLENSVIFIEEEVVVIATGGRSTMNIKEQHMYENMMYRLKKDLKRSDVRKEELMQFAYEISRGFFEANLGENYIWPFRCTVFMINRQSKWMIKHINFSFGGVDYEKVFGHGDIPRKFKNINIIDNCGDEILKIRKTISILQEAYELRDVSLVDKYVKELFTSRNKIFIFGADEGENFSGHEGVSRLLEGDWKYWGDFNLNEENLYIDVHDNIALVYSKAFLKYSSDIQEIYDSLGDLFHEHLLPVEKSIKEKLLKMLWKINYRLYDAERGKVYLVPMKFTAILVKEKENWKFQHIHFSDIVDEMPKERII
ncbi:hypothetical protein [Clostridium sp.]|uniref:hypothetical protein n=1 Tax=Clostridium sp. TaxID=1506 RepID=UPI0032167983